MSPRRIVVLGVGNLLMGDEGVGVWCVQALARDGQLPEGVGLIDGGTSTHELLEDLENLDRLVIVDAIAGDAPPGTISVHRGDEVPAAFSNRISPHQFGINDLLAKLRFLGRAPREVWLVAVSPARVALGLELSPRVAAALPELCRRVLASCEG